MSYSDFKNKAHEVGERAVEMSTKIMDTVKDKTRETISEINTSINKQKPTAGYRFRSRSQPHEWVLCDIKTQEKLAVNPDFEFQELVLR